MTVVKRRRGADRGRDVGLLDAAVHRPRASVLGQDADGNKRLAWLATYVFCAKNGVELDPSDDAAYDLVVGVAAGEIDDLDAMAEVLRSFGAGTIRE